MLDQTQNDLLEMVRDEDVRFIRLAYCDMHGQPKNMAIMSSQLRKAFEEGILFEGSFLTGTEGESAPDLLLFPDSATASILPWRPAHERVMRLLCDIRTPDGKDYVYSSRTILRDAVQQAADEGYIVNAGAECEFYLFRLDEHGKPTREPFDHASYHDVAPLDKGEDIRRDICLALEEMGLGPQESHHETGPGQNEIDFRYSDALSAADDYFAFRMAVKAVCSLHGAYASFMPKPLTGESGNGLHINLSLIRNGKNVFKAQPEHSRTGESFIAGVLAHAAEMTAFLNPIPNSYERLGTCGAPAKADWAHQARTALVRIPASLPERVRMELTSPDPSCNLYVALALIIRAGLDGIRRQMELPAQQPAQGTGLRRPDSENLPGSLGEALDLADGSEWIRESLPEEFLQAMLREKRREWSACEQAQNKHEHEMERYFEGL